MSLPLALLKIKISSSLLFLDHLLLFYYLLGQTYQDEVPYAYLVYKMLYHVV
jgi:hypothetical protein